MLNKKECRDDSKKVHVYRVNYCHTYMFQLNYTKLKHVGMMIVIHVFLPTQICFRDFFGYHTGHPYIPFINYFCTCF